MPASPALWRYAAFRGNVRTELTPEVEALILQSFRQGNSYRITAGLAGVNVDTLLGWLKQGKAERSPRLRKFYFDVRNVRALLDRASTESIKKGIMGGFFQVPVHDKEGHLIPEIDPVTGQIVRDQKGRSCFQMKTEYREPDAKLALRVLERLNRWEFGKTRGGVDLDWAELDQPASEEPEMIITTTINLLCSASWTCCWRPKWNSPGIRSFRSTHQRSRPIPMPRQMETPLKIKRRRVRDWIYQTSSRATMVTDAARVRLRS